MRHLGTIMMGLLALLAAEAAYAADVCLEQTGGAGAVYVGKSFKAPSRGHCAPWQGFIRFGSAALPYSSTGTACTSQDNDHVNISIHTPIALFAPNGVGTLDELLQLPLPLGSGASTFDYQITVNEAGVSTASASVAATHCSTTNVP